MRQTLVRTTLLVVAGLSLGCSKTDLKTAARIDELKAQNVDLNHTLESLDDKYEKLSQRLAAMEDELTTVKQYSSSLEEKIKQNTSSLEDSWKQFTAGYSPETLKALNQNSDAASKLLEDLKSANDVGNSTLASLQKLTEEIGQLKEQCKQNAKEANDANLVGMLKDDVAAMNAKVAKVEQSIGTAVGLPLTQRVQQIENNLRMLDSKLARNRIH